MNDDVRQGATERIVSCTERKAELDRRLHAGEITPSEHAIAYSILDLL